MKTQAALRHLSVLALPLGLSACISIGGGGDDRPAPALYTLQEPGSEVMNISTETRGRVVVAVPAPELPPGYDTERIAIQFEQDGRLDYYADARWSSRLDLLVQDVFIERAQQKLSGTIVGKPDLVPAPNYRLAVAVTDFGPVYQTSPDMTPRLDAGLNVTVIQIPQGTVVAQFSVKKSAPATENRLSTVTGELRGLLSAVIDEALEKAAPYVAEATNVVRAEQGRGPGSPNARM